MQHLRVVGETPDAVLLDVPGLKDKGKGKSKEMVLGEKVYQKCPGLTTAWDPKGSPCF